MVHSTDDSVKVGELKGGTICLCEHCYWYTATPGCLGCEVATECLCIQTQAELQLIKPHAMYDGTIRCCDLSAVCIKEYVKSPDNELCTPCKFAGDICCFKGDVQTVCIHPSTCLKLKNQCLCIYCYSSLPCDDEVPCGCALCGMKCAGEFVDPVAYNSKSKGPGAQTMERNLAPVAAGAGSAV